MRVPLLRRLLPLPRLILLQPSSDLLALQRLHLLLLWPPPNLVDCPVKTVPLRG